MIFEIIFIKSIISLRERNCVIYYAFYTYLFLKCFPIYIELNIMYKKLYKMIVK